MKRATGSFAVRCVALVLLSVSGCAKPDGRSDGPVRDIEVVVHDEHDQPVPGAAITASRDGEQWLSESALPADVLATTDAAGRALLHGVTSDLRFFAAVKVAIGASAFREASHKRRVDLMFATYDTELRGRVVDHHLKGVAGIEVVLWETRGVTCGTVLRRRVPEPLEVGRRTVSGADGKFAFRASRAWGTCFVSLRIARLRTDHVLKEIGTEGEIEFEVPGRSVLRGVVLDAQGEPVPGCEVWAGEPDCAFCFDTSTGSLVTADAAGRFEMPFLKGGRYAIVALGTASVPAGVPVEVDVVWNDTGRIELRTAKPASIRGKTVGMRGRPTRIVARPRPDDREEGRTREVLIAGDGEFDLPNLMRGVRYKVIAYQDGDEVARDWAIASADDVVLRNVNSGPSILSCKLSGDGLKALVGKQVQVAVHPVDTRGSIPWPEKEWTAVAWRGEAEIRFDDLPARDEAVAVVMVDGVELARSERFRPGKQPVSANLEVRADGAIDLLPEDRRADWCVWVCLADGSMILGRGITWQDAGAPFRCTLPAGDYLLKVGFEGGQFREADCTVVAGKTRRFDVTK